MRLYLWLCARHVVDAVLAAHDVLETAKAAKRPSLSI
jgi:hypothetical protein